MKTRLIAFLLLASGCFAATNAVADAASFAVGVYSQDVATVYTTETGLPSQDALAIAALADDNVFAGTESALLHWDGKSWKSILDGRTNALALQNGEVVAVVNDQVYRVGSGIEPKKIGAAPAGKIHALAASKDAVFIGSEHGLYVISKRSAKLDRKLGALLHDNSAVYAVACKDDGTIVVGGEIGLFEKQPDGAWTGLHPTTEDGRSWAPRNVQTVAYDRSGQLWFGSPQGVGSRGERWTLWTGHDGLPYNQFTGAGCGPKGEIWFSTDKGAIRYEDGVWNYRQGRRWVPADDVRAVSLSPNGSAWFATSGGVGVIERRPMTFAEKAKWYEDEIDKYNRRTEYGYVLEATVERPGDKSSHRNHDSDNDGLWTSMYGAGECYAYGATKDPKAKERAKNAFEALRFLSVAPIGGEVKQQPGYVARTVMETTESDPNQRPGYTLEGQKKNQEGDSLWKAYVPRWPLTKDKKYWYKTDTSSDELDGHYFFYGLYYDLVADTEEEKARVREVVVNLTDHLLRNNYCLVDHDGTPTRWAVYAPDKLNRDPLWSWERGLNSLSMLSYLTTAHHMTGDKKYAAAIKELCEKHAYDVNAINAKLQQGYGSGNHSDDEMAVMCFYNLLKYTKNEDLKKRMNYAFYRYMSTEWQEMNPFFNFAYAAVGQGATFTNAYSEWKLDPWNGWLDDSIDTLKRFPLDRFNWAHTNSHRLDVVMLPRAQRGDPVEPWDDVKKQMRGHRVNGKVIPVDERHFNHWNTDPWDLDYGGNGMGLADGAVYLLPYYMGLYHGFIKE